MEQNSCNASRWMYIGYMNTAYLTEVVVELHRNESGFYIVPVCGNETWTEDGYYDTREEAIAAAPVYVALCGLGTEFVITTADDAI